ncbi:hypothetical protein WN944_000267 [Citrus x changshan-huyou]|uniref:Legume lectin domain-containing protein n=1 Tax=Citrus x changshan-huyou TaxID=2935761 RepID=A0AAP0MF16_9ROSI
MISTTFTIRISQYPNSGAGDGMTFIFAPDTNPSPLDNDGSFLGIMSRSPHGGSVSQLALELDTFMNEFDPDANHIGIDATNMWKPITVTSLNGTGIDLKSGRNIKVQIDYDGWTKMLYVSMAYSGYPLGRILEKPIIMSDVVPSSVYVGFTAATGDFSESHQVLDWTFTTMPLPPDSIKSRKISKFPDATGSGDGMAFIMAQDNKPPPPNGYGSYLGIMDKSTQDGVVRQLAVELDTYMNEYIDPDGNHIGVDTTSMATPVAAKSLNSTGIDLKSGRNITVKID